jgi:hypothetical protein
MLSPDGSALRSLLPRLPASPALTRALPYLLAFACLLLTLVFGGKLWDSNDDVHMAMITHGYGIVSAPSPDVVYSNVIWGWLAMQLGTHSGVEGYTLLMYAALLGSAAAIAYALYRNRIPGLAGAALLLAMYLHTLLEPQFTVAAGYAALAGIALLMSLREGERRWTAACSVLFLVLAGLLRLQELLFVGLVSAPFLAWWLYRQRGNGGWRTPAAVLLGSLVLVAGCKLVDMQHYSGPEWTRFKQMNQLRRPFTDYGMARYLQSRPELLAGTGMSQNDIDMLGSWFFLDDKVYNPASLEALQAKVSRADFMQFNLGRYDSLGGPLGESQIRLLLALMLVAALACAERRAAACGVLVFLCATGTFLLLGRAGVVRVYPAPLAAVALLCLLEYDVRRARFLALLGLVAAGFAVFSGWHFFRAHAVDEQRVRAVRKAVCAIPGDALQIGWGETEGFTDRFIYTPTAPPGGRCPLTLYLIGVMELYPGNLDQLHRFTGGPDFIPALLAGQRFTVLTSDDRLELLRRYLQEHYAATLTVEEGAVAHFAHQRVIGVAKPR